MNVDLTDLDDIDLDPYDFRVLFRIIHRCNGQAGEFECYESIAFMAETLRISFSTVRRSLRRLEAIGAITRSDQLGRCSRFAFCKFSDLMPNRTSKAVANDVDVLIEPVSAPQTKPIHLQPAQVDPAIVNDQFLRSRYGVSASTIYRLRKRQHNPLPHFFVGGQVRYKLSDIEAFFKS